MSDNENKDNREEIELLNENEVTEVNKYSL
jgi:hypothetical protein